MEQKRDFLSNYATGWIVGFSCACLVVIVDDLVFYLLLVSS